jgi:hypothetical protein
MVTVGDQNVGHTSLGPSVYGFMDVVKFSWRIVDRGATILNVLQRFLCSIHH